MAQLPDFLAASRVLVCLLPLTPETQDILNRDTLARLQPGVLTAPSHQQDSFSDGLLEGPHFSRPEVLAIEGQSLDVPPVLLSGHHAHIERWRREQRLAATARQRPELITAARQAGRLSPADEAFLAGL